MLLFSLFFKKRAGQDMVNSRALRQMDQGNCTSITLVHLF